MTVLRFVLPLSRELGIWPVSTNSQYKRGWHGRPVLTREAKAWKENVAAAAFEAWYSLPTIDAQKLTAAKRLRVTMVYQYVPGTGQTPDADNGKLAVDALQVIGRKDKDFDVEARKEQGAASQLTVTVTPVGEGE